MAWKSPSVFPSLTSVCIAADTAPELKPTLNEGSEVLRGALIEYVKLTESLGPDRPQTVIYISGSIVELSALMCNMSKVFDVNVV